jgi:hypothetical protein
LESTRNILPEKVPYIFVGQPLLWKFSIFKADARMEDLKIFKSCKTKVGCNKHMDHMVFEFLKKKKRISLHPSNHCMTIFARLHITFYDKENQPNLRPILTWCRWNSLEPLKIKYFLFVLKNIQREKNRLLFFSNFLKNHLVQSSTNRCNLLISADLFEFFFPT